MNKIEDLVEELTLNDMKESFELSATFNVPASRIYDAWFDGNSHEAMTGGEASCGDQINDPFTAWDGYIWGKM